MAGKIVILNGTSSSGKSTIASLLQQSLAEPFMICSIDSFLSMYSDKVTEPQNEEDVAITIQVLPRVIEGFHRSVAALAGSDNNVIVDHVLQEEEWRRQCLEEWADLDVLYVAVKCPLPILEQRERERGDRVIGTAEYQFPRVHEQIPYDVEVDTSLLTPTECVQLILEAMASRSKK